MLKYLLRAIIHLLIRFPLTEERGFKLATFIRWNYRQESVRPLQITYDQDIRIWVRLHHLLEAQIFYQGADRKDRGEMRLLDRLLRQDSVFFDVGGNIGVMAMYAAKRVPLGRVHTFEPLSANIDLMQANLALNDFQNIVVNKTAASNVAGELAIHVLAANNTGATSLYPEAGETTPHEMVQAVRLDEYVAEHGIDRIDVVKLDVEGAEMDALEGFRESLQRFRPHVVMEVTRSIIERAGRSPDEIIEFWHDLGYQIYDIGHQAQLTPIQHAGQLRDDHNIYCSPGQ